uniref:Uncharacterized protein n=1 Tax=Grammatophora oceanica TaxID=210454 RepID=A0A7S1UZK5_9STRA|eukprot:CAMPEP_0194036084 /NCGR_PEP_ID=MMETSP0009_2-20130614/8470_1 /TAXON_ID=210454 /ORGANISM="Grammatophora oceanica, Strain CCMP 410" /LENGTH=581 /DNA_ID=CAMNT_0038677695 /DNA_START=120 /DNA_END=1868 /DNA_ORIENTATION=+
MRSSGLQLLLALSASSSAVQAFWSPAAPTAFVTTGKQQHQQQLNNDKVAPSAPSSSSTTCLHISLARELDLEEMGFKEKSVDPSVNLQAYLSRPENGTTPRANLQGSCIVSGLLKPDGIYRDDQTIFNLLNDEDSKFKFDALIAHSTDIGAAKKRMVSRKARYTGLLDVLEFKEGASSIPSPEALEGCTSWVHYVDDNHEETCLNIARLYRDTPSLENVAIMLAEATHLPQATLESIWATFNETGKEGFSVMAVGELTDTPESNNTYGFFPFGAKNKYSEMKTNGNKTVTFDTSRMFELSRALGYRVLTDMLQLKVGEGKALTFVQLVDPEYERRCLNEWKLINGLREGGFTRSEELEHMMDRGVQKFAQACYEYRQTPYYKYKNTNYGNNWWEHPKYANDDMAQKERRDALQAIEDKYAKNNNTIMEIALEWGQREYYKGVVSGKIDRSIPETDYIVSRWDECMEIGQARFVELFGPTGDRDLEEEKWQELLKKKERAAEAKAEENLEKMLAELEQEFPDAYTGENAEMSYDAIDSSAPVMSSTPFAATSNTNYDRLDIEDDDDMDDDDDDVDVSGVYTD